MARIRWAADILCSMTSPAAFRLAALAAVSSAKDCRSLLWIWSREGAEADIPSCRLPRFRGPSAVAAAS